MNKLKQFTTAAAVIALLAVPGIASATVIIDLNTLAPGTTTSGTTYADPMGLDFNLTITGFDSGVEANLKTNPDGMGVDDLGSTSGNALDAGDSILFEFDPFAYLEGFTLNLAANDTYYCSAVGNPNLACFDTVGNAIELGNNTGTTFIDTNSTATSLTIVSLAGSGFRVGSLSFADPVVSNVPEPAVIALFGLGLLGVGFARRKA